MFVEQMNGAELAEGVELRVEPSASSAQEMAPVIATKSDVVTAQKDAEESQDEDLDDFFDSL